MNLWFYWEIFVNFIEAFFIYYFYSRILGIKEKQKRKALIGMCLLMIIICFLNYLNMQIIIDKIIIYTTRYLMIIPNVIFCIFCFNGNISKKILLGIVPTLISMIADAGTLWIASLTSNTDIETATQFGVERYALTISYLLFSAIIYLLIVFIAKRQTLKGLFLPSYLRIYLFIILIMSIIAVDLLIDSSFAASLIGNPLLAKQLVFVNILFLAISFSVFILIEYIAHLTQKNIDYALEIQQAKMEQDYFKKLERAIDMVKEAKHDIKNQMIVLHGLLKAGQYDELNKYFEALSMKYDQDLSIVLTPNPTINALLSSKLFIAKEENIHFIYQIQSVEQLPEQYMDICSILGNLIDNAIEACIRIPDKAQRFINLLIENKNEMLFIRVKNSFDGILFKEKQRYLTRKSGYGHGIGIRHIEKLVSKFGGHISIDTKNHIFMVSVLLPLE